MGSEAAEADRDERPVHEVCVDHFYMGVCEVTQGQWKEIMGDNPSFFKKCGDDCPVENVSWNDAQEFISSSIKGRARNIACRLRPSGNMPQGAAAKKKGGPGQAMDWKSKITCGTTRTRAAKPTPWARKNRTKLVCAI